MGKSQEQLQSILNSMKLNTTFDFVSKLTRCVTSYIGSCIDKVVRYQKEAITKRLQKRRHRLFEDCKYTSDKIRCKCECKRCTKHRQIRRRNIVEADIMNFVSNTRPIKDDILKGSIGRKQMSCTDNDRSRPWILTETRAQDHRDVLALDRTRGWEWWMKMQQSAAYMPSLKNDVAAPTKSMYSSSSSLSYFKSRNALAILNEELDEMQTNNSTNDRTGDKSSGRSRMEKRSRQPREGSKSDSKIESGRDKTEPSSIFRSASTKTTCVRRSMNKRKNLVLTKRRFRKRRPYKTRSYRATSFYSSRYFKNLLRRK